MRRWEGREKERKELCYRRKEGGGGIKERKIERENGAAMWEERRNR